MSRILPIPPFCPCCGENRYGREGFFPLASFPPWEQAILARCENCGLRRFMLASGSPPPLRARPRWVSRRLLRRIIDAGPRALLVAPAGTDVFSIRCVTRWGDNIPSEPLDLVWLWLSLEERLDVAGSLVRILGRLRPGGVLRVTAVNSESLSFRLNMMPDAYLEQSRQRVLFTPRLLAGFLREAGFKRGRVSYSLIRPVMQAEARAPE